MRSSFGDMNPIDHLDLVDFQLAVGADIWFVMLWALSAHDHVPAVEKHHIPTVAIANNAYSIVCHLGIEVVATELLPPYLPTINHRLNIAPQPATHHYGHYQQSCDFHVAQGNFALEVV